MSVRATNRQTGEVGRVWVFSVLVGLCWGCVFYLVVSAARKQGPTNGEALVEDVFLSCVGDRVI